MLKIIIAYFIFVNYINCILGYINECTPPLNNTKFLPDYYWRDYKGIIPDDAIRGGYDEAGSITYIGQSLQIDDFSIIPGVIYPGKLGMTATAENYSSYVRILCSPFTRLFQLTRTNTDEIHLITDHLVFGGLEKGNLLYIGRANFEGELQVGKVFSKPSYDGLMLRTKSDTTRHFYAFEILTYTNY